ncbi:MAG: hypothetical protein IT379_09800 [Deltaproteobacteria bacterium]|nr:hypothetical protein [Deltaproteobacteria bacterium]
MRIGSRGLAWSAAFLMGCAAQIGGGTGEGEGPTGDAPADPFDVDVGSTSQELTQNVLERRAIFLGNKLASSVFEAALNAEVIRFGMSAQYVDVAMTPSAPRQGYFQSSTLGEGSFAPIDPATPAAAAGRCVFATRPDAIDASALSCRFVAREAGERAITRGVQRIAEEPLDPALMEDAPNPAEVAAWYARAFDFGLLSSPEIAVSALRNAGLCDQEPTQEAAAFERGVELGRTAMREAAAAQQAVTPRTECNVDTGIVNPARDGALGTVPSLANANPLCPGYVPADAAETGRLAGATEELEAGIRAGIDEQAREESARLVREWVCEIPTPAGGGGGGGGGDPLVLDMDGDGVHVEPIAYGANYDLGTSNGERRMQWIHGDAFVVMDRDGDGRITHTELFGDITVTEDGATARDGFAALMLYDAISRGGNADGLFDRNDAAYDALALWMDRDGDARTDDGELVSLRDAGIAVIDVARGRWLDAGGDAHAAVDVWFNWD